MTAVTVFALLCVFAPELLPRRAVAPARVLAVAGMVLAGTSRMWAGVHWFSDTWGAVIWALVPVLTVLALRPAIEAAFGAIGRRMRGRVRVLARTRVG